jgi:hypothetical protein
LGPYGKECAGHDQPGGEVKVFPDLLEYDVAVTVRQCSVTDDLLDSLLGADR